MDHDARGAPLSAAAEVTRAALPFDSSTPRPDDILAYAAGIVDTDGTFNVTVDAAGTAFNLVLSVTQAERGASVLHFMHRHFGGRVSLHRRGNDKHQTSYTWLLCDAAHINAVVRLIEPWMTVKLREARRVLEYPLGNTHHVEVLASHAATGEQLRFAMLKDLKARFPSKQYWALPEDGSALRVDGWELQRALSAAQIAEIRGARKSVRDDLMRMHTMPHEDIAEGAVARPAMSAYFAGVFDGDGCIDTDPKTRSSHKHSLAQAHRPLLLLCQRRYGGGVYAVRQGKAHRWDIGSTQAAEFLRDIAPFLVGKKAQADLVLAMRPGEAAAVHAALRALKGNCTAPTPVLDAIAIGAIGGGASAASASAAAAEAATDAEGSEAGGAPPAAAPHPVTGFKRGAKELPRGVHAMRGRFIAKLRVDGQEHLLGTLDTADEAAAQYAKYSRAVKDHQKGLGPAVDLGFCGRARQQEERRAAQEAEAAAHADAPLPPGVYRTAAGTYQARGRAEGRVVQLGTHRTVAAAVEAQARHAESLDV